MLELRKAKSLLRRIQDEPEAFSDADILELEVLLADFMPRPHLTYREFAAIADPDYQWWWHNGVMADRFEDLMYGRVENLMVSCPVRHSKSRTMSEIGTAYYLYKYPFRRVGLSSATDDLAVVLSMNAQGYYAKVVATVLGEKFPKQSAHRWETGLGGYLWATGVGGQATGLGGHCFPGETLVHTAEGQVPIADLVYRPATARPLVLSFDHATQSPCWRRISAVSSRVADGLVEISTVNGHTIRCTHDHPIYVPGRGYVPAALLRPHDPLSVVRAPETSPSQDVRGLLRGQPPSAGPAGLRAMPAAVSPHALRGDEGAAPGLDGNLLLLRVLVRRACGEERTKLPPVRCADAGATRAPLLQCRVPSVGAAETAPGVPTLPRDVPAEWLPPTALLATVCRRHPFTADDGGRELPFPIGDQLRRVVPPHATAHPRAGWRALSGVLGAAAPTAWASEPDALNVGDPPYRRATDQQQTGEPGDALRDVSCGTPQVEADAVAVVCELRAERVRVYDLEVEGTHNFFAGSVLAHNCLISDDPIKNSAEAESQVVRIGRVKWFESTWFTRAEPNCRRLVIGARFHEEDPLGWILNQNKLGGEHARRWHIINFELLRSDDPYEVPNRCTLEPDPRPVWNGRTDHEAAALCPARMPLREILAIKAVTSAYYWNAIYQGRPKPVEGILFKVEWFQPVGAMPAEVVERVWFFDLAGSDDTKNNETTDNDYTVGIRMSKDRQGIYYIEDMARFRLRPGGRNARIRVRMDEDASRFGSPHEFRVGFEAEAGVEGDDRTRALTSALAGYRVSSWRPRRSKVSRAMTGDTVFAESLLSQAETGNLRLVAGDWNAAFLNEFRAFPYGIHDDIVDATVGAFEMLAASNRPDFGGVQVVAGEKSVSAPLVFG